MSDRPAPDFIDTERVLGRTQQHVAVIDIGSNSIRLVVYDDLSRAPFPRFNEKSFCALGAAIDADGRLATEAIARAVTAVRRFAAIARAMQVQAVHVLATEATRRAVNRDELVDAIRAHTGLATRVLSGHEEATYAAYGVISGFFHPHGLSGDLGGGSLELAEVRGDSVGERLVSLPMGALPVAALLRDGIDAAKKAVDAVLRESLADWPDTRVFYAVGGGWRALGRIHLAAGALPIGVVHGHEIGGGEARTLAKRIARMTPDVVAALPDVPGRRVDTLPAAALVMARLLRILRPERVAFSALGLREGWVYRQLPDAEQARDPLLEGTQAIGLPGARVPGFSAALARWTEGLFPDETVAERRLRLAVCALTDLAWRDHDKVRAEQSYRRLLQFPFIGISHAERAFLAIAVMARYGGRADAIVAPAVAALLTPAQLRRAEVLGRVLLLGHRFSASVPEILAGARVRLAADAVRLEVTHPEHMPDSEAVQARLKQLARVCEVESAEVVAVTP
jgi:exopolyphosphatase/guanosine-5'-triphosphate,3'-diphosphate pyrophosphatase